MLCGEGDDVVLLAAVEVGDPLDRHVVRFGGTRGEDDLLLTRIQQTRHMLSRLIHRKLCLPAVGMCLGVRVAVHTRHIGQHGIQHPNRD